MITKLPNTFRELLTMDLSDTHVQFKEHIESLEGYADPFMRAKLLSITESPHDDVIKLRVDFDAWRTYNAPRERSNWYLKDGSLGTATEAGKYHSQDELFVMGTHNPNDFMEIIDEGKKRYTAVYIGGVMNLIQIDRFETDNLDRDFPLKPYAGQVQFLFEGWPKKEGEK